MKQSKPSRESYEEIDRQARDTSDIRPMSAAIQRRWEAAKRTGVSEPTRRGRPRKRPELKSRIVPVSMTPALLKKVDSYARRKGLTRSALIAEALRLKLTA